MTRQEIQNIVNHIIDQREQYNLYNVSPIPFHTHNGTDSPIIPFSGFLGITIYDGNATLSNEIVVLADARDGAMTLTMPNSVGNFGRQIIVKDWQGVSSTKNITIQPFSGQTIDGATNKIINANYAALYLLSDGANWTIL